MAEIKTGQRWEFHYTVDGTNINELFIAEILQSIGRARIVQVLSSRNWKIGDEFGHSILTEKYWRYLPGQDNP